MYTRQWLWPERLPPRLAAAVLLAAALIIAYVSAEHLILNTASRVWVLVCLALPGALAVVLARLPGRLTPWQFLAALGIAALLLKGAAALLIPTQPESDFWTLYDAARQLAQGHNLLNTETYFQRWPYQSGFVAWMAFWIRCFDTGVPFFQLTNALYAAASNCLIYALARRFASEAGARGAALLYLFYPGTYFLLPVLTNQHLSELLLLWACFLLAYVLGWGALNGAVILSGLNELGLTNQVPEWKWILGLNPASLGRYSPEDAAAVFQSGRPVSQAAETLLRARLAIAPGDLLELFWEKIRIMWGSFEDPSWALTGQVWADLAQLGWRDGALCLVQALCCLASGMYLWIALMAGAGALARLCRPRPFPWPGTLVMLCALGYFAAHLFIEIQPRYRSTMTVFLLLLAASGLDLLRRRPAAGGKRLAPKGGKHIPGARRSARPRECDSSAADGRSDVPTGRRPGQLVGGYFSHKCMVTIFSDASHSLFPQRFCWRWVSGLYAGIISSP